MNASRRLCEQSPQDRTFIQNLAAIGREEVGWTADFESDLPARQIVPEWATSVYVDLAYEDGYDLHFTSKRVPIGVTGVNIPAVEVYLWRTVVVTSEGVAPEETTVCFSNTDGRAEVAEVGIDHMRQSFAGAFEQINGLLRSDVPGVRLVVADD